MTGTVVVAALAGSVRISDTKPSGICAISSIQSVQ